MNHLIESFADIDNWHLLGKCKKLGAKVYISLIYLIGLVDVDFEDQGILDAPCCYLFIEWLIEIDQVEDSLSSLLKRLSSLNHILSLRISHCKLIESCDFSSRTDMKQLHLIIAYDLEQKAILEFDLFELHIRVFIKE